MRKTKYRVWDTEEKCFMEHSRVIESRLLDLEKNGEGRFVFQQWTGLLDKKSNHIFEGDILKVNKLTFDSSAALPGNLNVKYYGGMFQLYRGDENLMGLHLGYIEDGEVIGNIYENPELLKN